MNEFPWILQWSDHWKPTDRVPDGTLFISEMECMDWIYMPGVVVRHIYWNDDQPMVTPIDFGIIIEGNEWELNNWMNIIDQP
jgi:hypothetical protein